MTSHRAEPHIVSLVTVVITLHLLFAPLADERRFDGWTNIRSMDAKRYIRQ